MHIVDYMIAYIAQTEVLTSSLWERADDRIENNKYRHYYNIFSKFSQEKKHVSRSGKGCVHTRIKQ